MTNQHLAIQIGLVAAIIATLLGALYWPPLQSNPVLVASIVGGLGGCYGKWFGKPLPAVLVAIIRDMEPAAVRAIIDAQSQAAAVASLKPPAAKQ